MDKIRSIFFNKFESLLLSVGGKRSKWRQLYIKHKDEAIGREIIGVDKFGNKYY